MPSRFQSINPSDGSLIWEGPAASPEDIRYWDLVSYMAGARGMLYLRWRPLLDGPLFGAFGALYTRLK
jgi:hypothetical protein